MSDTSHVWICCEEKDMEFFSDKFEVDGEKEPQDGWTKMFSDEAPHGYFAWLRACRGRRFFGHLAGGDNYGPKVFANNGKRFCWFEVGSIYGLVINENFEFIKTECLLHRHMIDSFCLPPKRNLPYWSLTGVEEVYNRMKLEISPLESGAVPKRLLTQPFIPDGNTLLHLLAQSRAHLLLARDSLSKKDLLIKNRDGWTPAHYAARSGSLTLVSELWDKELLLSTSKEGWTPFGLSIAFGYSAMLLCRLAKIDWLTEQASPMESVQELISSESLQLA